MLWKLASSINRCTLLNEVIVEYLPKDEASDDNHCVQLHN